MTQREFISGSIAFATLVAALVLAFDAARAADPIPKADEILRRYIPSSRLDAVAGKDTPGVLLPITEFDALLKDAAAKAGDAGSRPEGAALLRADYALRIHEESLRVTCRISLRSFDALWQTIRIPVTGLSVLSAKFEGTADGDGVVPVMSRDARKPDELVLLLSEPGLRTLVLELVTPLAASGGDSAAAFHLANAPLGEMSLTLPPKKQLRLDGILLQRPAADEQPAEYKVAIGGRPEVRLVITDRKAIDRTDAMTFASTAFGVLASPGEATWTARTQLSVFGRPLDKLECEVPSALEITDVESQGLEAWQLNDGPHGRTRITLTWRQPFDGVRPITFRGVFASDRDGRWHVPNLDLHNVSSHTGSLLLERPSGVRLQVVQSTGLRPVTVEATKEPARSTSESRYEIWRENFDLTFIPAAKEREVQAAMSTLVSFNAQGADLMTTVDLETRFAPLFEADILLPAAWQILEATQGGGQAAKWQLIPDEAGRNRIRVPLVPPLSPGENRSLRVVAHFEPEGWPVASSPIRVALPEVRLPQAGVVEALYGVTADSDLEVIPLDIVGLIPARQADVDTLNKQLASFNRTVRLGFTYQDTAFQGQLEIRRLPARLTATCVTLTRIDAEEIASHIEAQLTIGGGGVRELNVQLPEAVGRDLRFVITHFQPRPLFGVNPASSAAVQQVAQLLPPLPIILEQKAGPAANGIIPWMIKLDRYALGTFVLQAEVTQRRAAAATGQVQQWNVPALTLVGADRESGAIGIEAADDQHIQATARDAAGQPLETVDPIDFPPAHVQPRERLVAAFSYERPGWSVAVSEERLTRIAMPTAVIHKLSLASIIGPDGVKQVQADATLSAVGIQSLVVRLPEGHGLWGALIDGVPVPVHKSGDSLSLPLSPFNPPSRAREIRLSYAPHEPGASVQRKLSGFSVQEAPPRFLVVTGQGAEQPLNVLMTQWTVHHPSSLDLIDTTGVFHTGQPLVRDSLVHRLVGLFSVPEGGDVLWRVAILSAIGLAIWLLSAARRRLSPATLGCFLVLLSVPLVVGGVLVLSGAPRSSSRVTATSPAPAGEPAPRFSDGVEVFDAPAPEPAPRGVTAPTLQSNDFFKSELKSELDTKFIVDEAAVQHLKEQDELRDLTRRESLSRQPQRVPAMAGRPPQNAAEKPKSDRFDNQAALADRRSGGVMGRGEGFLSVAFGLQPPTGSRSAILESTSDTPDTGLSIRFMDQRTRNVWTGFAAFAVAVLGWWLRKARFTSRLLFLLVTLLGPIACRWVIPLSWLPLSDGIWLGGAATAALWFIRCLVIGICDCPCMSRWCRPRGSVAAPLLALLVLGWTSASQAQPAAAGVKSAPLPMPETVFIPYDNAREPLSAKNVFIPQELFLKLWRSAHPEDLPPTKPPVSAAVSAAAFVIDATAAQAEAAQDSRRVSVTAPVTARLVLNNLTTKPVRLKLPIRAVAIRSAVLDGSPAVLESRDNSLFVSVSRSGTSVLDLQFDVMVDRTGPAGVIRWENIPLPAGLLTLKLPASDPALEVRVGGARISAAGPAPEGSVSFEIPVDRGGAQEIRWQPTTGRSGDHSPVQVQTVTSVTVDDSGLRTRSEYTARVSQAGVTELTLAFPGAMNLVAVEGRDIGGWRIEGENAGRRLLVYFSRKIEAQTVFTVEAFQGIAIDERQQSVTILPPQPEGVSREAGEVGVYVAGHLAVRPGTVTGLVQQDVSRFERPRPNTAAPANPLQLAYRYSARPISLELLLQRRQAETRADLQHGIYLTQRKLRVSTRTVLHVAGAPRSTLSLLLPAGYLLLDVTSPALADYSTTESDGGRKILTVEFDQPRTGDVELLVDGSLARRPEEPSSSLVVPRVLDVSKVDSQLGVWIEDMYVATADGLGDWKNADPNSLDERLRSLRPAAIQFGFRSAALDPQPVTIGLRAQAAELSADVLSLIAISNASIDYGFTMQWRITRAATDTFAFTTPGWLRGKLDFAGPGIRQVISTDLPGDRVKWTVSLTDPVRENYLLTAAAALPSPADGRVLAPEIVFESSGAGGAASRLEAQRHFAVVVNLSRRPVALEDPSAVEIVRRDALPLKVPDQLVRQAMNIVQVLPGRTASWLARKVGEAASLQATITGAKLETVVETDGSWRTQATYTLRNRGRQYLPVDLTAMGNVRVLSILVKGNPARALETKVGAKSLHLVPLPPSSVADLSYDVVIMLAGKLDKGLPKETSIASTTLELPAPHIVSPNESAQFGMSVAQTAWIVRLPNGVQAEIDDTGNLTPHQAAEWELLADAQFLSQLEADADEMLRIVTDAESSGQRKGQAWFNLHYLNSTLDNNRDRIEEDARKAESLLGEKGVELSRSNSARTDALKAKVEQQLQQAGQGLAAGGSQPASPATPPVPQLQGSLDLNFDFGASGPANAPQSGEGRAYILGNSRSIISSNSALGDADKDGAVEFGFNAPKQQEDKLHEAELSKAAKAPSRSGLKRKLAEQQQATPAPNFSGGLRGGARGPDQPMGGIGGLAGNATLEFREGAETFGLFSRFAAPAAAGGANQWSEGAVAGTVLAAAPAVSTSGAGLSLAMTLPAVGEESLAFSKVGGSPRLVLKARSTEARRTAWGLGEVAVAVLITVLLLSAARSAAGLARTLAIVMAIAAAAAFLFLPSLGSWIALTLFAVALVTLALNREPRSEPVAVA